jgi:hypothetical protein
LSNVTVKVKETNAGTVTGTDGKFSLYKVKPTDTIVFSFMGYESQEVKAGSSANKTYNIVMKENKGMLAGEIIIVKKQSPVKKVWHKIKGIF